MPKSRKPDQNSMANLLSAMAHDNGWEKQLDLHSIFLGWRDLAAGEMAEHAQPLKIEREILWLEVENSSWLQQFQYEKLELLDKLNSSLRTARLRDIKMVLRKERNTSSTEKRSTAVSFVRPGKEQIAAFEKQIQCIADEQCRKALMQFWYLAQACRRKKE